MPTRNLLWQEMGPVDSVEFEVPASETARHDAFGAYLRAANLRIVDVATDGVFRAVMTRFPEITFAHVTAPEAVVDWPRDRLSWQRAAAVVCLEGAVSTHAEGAVWTREPGLTLVPPGDTPVRFELTGERNRILYLSLPASMVTELNLPDHAPRVSDALPDEALRPLVAFVTSLSAVRIPGETAAGPLQAASAEVARALVRLITEGHSREVSLFSRAMRAILSQYQDQRLTVTTLARDLGVSARSLQAAFAEEGTTVVAEIRAQRGRAAVAMRRGNPHMPSVELAAAVGFGSLSSLFRALREQADEGEGEDEGEEGRVGA
ncbi:helix-turn-helix transcriptional regulator [Microbacterium aquimaris]|uniref:Helix-turn-helix domain-containing protein n=1 Tax=Microbacterium aquimaris TaxID=459816 RepID=A0ABU5N2W4_9MICO|nr:helix-turn-helix domain-containing protein [Microbacterium aquimaris]MDZ8160401.1 helix-turn-helix domain-containing protein [Microbacterium aquimaris]